MTFSEIKQGLDGVTADIVAETARLNQGKSQITLANNNLGALATKYAALVTAVNGLATAEPSNAAATLAKAEKDKLVAEFQALKTTAQAMVTALNGI